MEAFYVHFGFDNSKSKSVQHTHHGCVIPSVVQSGYNFGTIPKIKIVGLQLQGAQKLETILGVSFKGPQKLDTILGLFPQHNLGTQKMNTILGHSKKPQKVDTILGLFF